MGAENHLPVKNISLSGVVLVTGPARSGKSEWAETLALHSGRSVVYIATAQGDDTDAEWQERIAVHRRRRPRDWTTQEVPLDLAAAIDSTPGGACVLIDSLGTWLANVLDLEEAPWAVAQDELLLSLQSVQNSPDGLIIIVAEETGWGVVPAYPLGRTFRDRLGSLTRRIGAIARPVYLVTAGYALDLSVLGTPLPNPMLPDNA